MLYPRGRGLSSAVWSAPSLEIDAGSVLHTGIDGEAATLAPPLRFTIRPKALRVRIAAGHARHAKYLRQQ